MNHTNEVKIEIARHYFSEVRVARLEILSLRAQIDSLQNTLGLRGIDYTRPYVQTSYVDKTPEIIDKLRTLVANYQTQIDFQCDMLGQAESLLSTLCVNERVVLQKYYIQGLTWLQVASSMDYSLSHIFRIHDLALLHACDGLSESTQNNIYDILRGE